MSFMGGPGHTDRMPADMDSAVVAAKAGDETAFTALAERHRRELQIHCYRMLGSLEDSEDLVQETFLRAWRGRARFTSHGRASFRAWLFRIATNACLDALERRPRRLLPSQLGPPSDPTAPPLPAADLPWLQPYPDHLIAPGEEEPDAVLVSRETIEIAFLAAIQLLSPRQRAALIARDVLGWSAKETAALLEASVASANSLLQRARATMKEHLPARRVDWVTAAGTAQEREVVRRFMAAFDRSDLAAVAELLREDARGTMPPYPMWHDGRDAITTAMAFGFDPTSPGYMGRWRSKPTGANLMPAVAFYLQSPGETEYRAFGIDVLRIEDGKIAEITAFVGDRWFARFGLPPLLPAQ
jgi:RNA polymerase sigma-70 factor, ECF subfamily